MKRFSTIPQRFHLEWSPDASHGDVDVAKLITNITNGCQTIDDGTFHPGANLRTARLTDCRRDVSKGEESLDPNHLTYQNACLELLKAHVSEFKMVSASNFPEQRNGTVTILGYSILQSQVTGHTTWD